MNIICGIKLDDAVAPTLSNKKGADPETKESSQSIALIHYTCAYQTSLAYIVNHSVFQWKNKDNLENKNEFTKLMEMHLIHSNPINLVRITLINFTCYLLTCYMLQHILVKLKSPLPKLAVLWPREERVH